MNIDNLPKFWLVMNGCIEAHESSVSIDAHVGPSTTCQIFGLQWMGAWKHMSHRFQLRHMCENMDNLSNLWLVMVGCIESHGSPFPIKAHV